MAGHSKWANIKHVKARQDAKRSKVFAKIARGITIAARIGGGDPDMNPRLRLAVMKGRGSNMPADNIQRAIARGTGEGEGANFEELAYEIYGPHGVAILCEIATDNRNRTASEIRAILTRNEGKIATAGAVSRLFHRKGQILVAADNAEEEALMEIAQHGPPQRLVGLQLEGRRTPRQHMAVLGGSNPIGEVTSGCLSPTFGYPIAMALVDSAFLGTEVSVDFGKNTQPATVTPLPFYRRKN